MAKHLGFVVSDSVESYRVSRSTSQRTNDFQKTDFQRARLRFFLRWGLAIQTEEKPAIPNREASN